MGRTPGGGRDQGMKGRGKGIFLALVIATVAAAVIGGLILLGPPAQERMRHLDARRVSDLQAVAKSVDIYWTRHGRLPTSLDELSREPGLSVQALDPETGQPYEYTVLSGNKYELCAHFAHDPGEGEELPQKDFWSYGVGKWCFHLEGREVKR